MYVFNIKAEKYYFINGLRRSGNHFFISWIISNHKRVLFINDVNKTPILTEKFHKKEFNDKCIYRESNSFHDEINKNLLSKNDNIDNIDCLIFTMEDKKLNVFYETISHFKIPKTSKSYIILIMRDILNNIASRLETSHIVSNQFQFAVDEYFIDTWYSFLHDTQSHKLNYNMFILDKDNYRKNKGLELELPELNNHVLSKVPQFGLGSSFSPKSKETDQLINLLNRYRKFQTEPIYKIILKNKKIYKILRDVFDLGHKIAFCFMGCEQWHDYFETQYSMNKFNIYTNHLSSNDAHINTLTDALHDDILNKYFIIIPKGITPSITFKKFYQKLHSNRIESMKYFILTRKYVKKLLMKNVGIESFIASIKS